VHEANQHGDPADRLEHLELRGPHDLRRTFATWLEDAGIPSRVIDELMGHEGGTLERGVSPMGALYREPTPEMLARATDAIDDRLVVALKVATRVCCPKSTNGVSSAAAQAPAVHHPDRTGGSFTPCSIIAERGLRSQGPPSRIVQPACLAAGFGAFASSADLTR
jgi:hypothetical protein